MALWLILLGAILVVFGRSFLNDFVNWDDGQLIYGNPNLNPPTGSGLLKHWIPTDPGNVSMYDPLVFTAWWTLAHVAQLQFADTNGATLNPQVFHAINLLVHWLTACVVLELLRHLRLPKWPSLAGAMLFAIHPIQTEAVVWATALKDLLCGVLTLTAVWRYLIAEEAHALRLSDAPLDGPSTTIRSDSARSDFKPQYLDYWSRFKAEWHYTRPQVLDFVTGFQLTGAARERWNFIVATLLYLGALLAKPSAVIAPILALIISLVWNRRRLFQAILPLTSWLILGAVFTGIAKWVQDTSSIHIPLPYRPLIAGDALAFYLAKLVLPINLCFDYGRDPTTMIRNPGQFGYAIYWSWIVPALLGLIIWRLRRRYLALAGLLFIAALLPVLGLTTFVFQYFSTVADRYVYVAMIGPSIALAWLIWKFPRGPIVVGVVAVFPVLACLSIAQAGIWHDTARLYERNFALHDQSNGNWRLYITYGKYRDLQAGAALNLGMAAGKRGDRKTQIEQKKIFDDALHGAIELYLKSLAQEPLNGEVYDDLATDYLALGRPYDAIEMTRREIEVAPNTPGILRQDSAKLHQTLGLEYLGVGRYADAIQEMETSLGIKKDPDVEKKLIEARARLAASRPATSRPTPPTTIRSSTTQ